MATPATKKPHAADLATIVPPTAGEPVTGPVVDFVAGVRKVGPRLYAVVTGKLVDGVPDVKVDAKNAQPLEYAAEQLLAELRRMMADMP